MANTDGAHVQMQQSLRQYLQPLRHAASRRTLSHAAPRRTLSHAAPRRALSDLWQDRRGAVSVEYGLIIVMVVLVITGAISTLGSEVFVDLYTRIAEGVRGGT